MLIGGRLLSYLIYTSPIIVSISGFWPVHVAVVLQRLEHGSEGIPARSSDRRIYRLHKLWSNSTVRIKLPLDFVRMDRRAIQSFWICLMPNHFDRVST